MIWENWGNASTTGSKQKGKGEEKVRMRYVNSVLYPSVILSVLRNVHSMKSDPPAGVNARERNK